MTMTVLKHILNERMDQDIRLEQVNDNVEKDIEKLKQKLAQAIEIMNLQCMLHMKLINFKLLRCPIKEQCHA
jgi:hypothetical protein